MSGIKNSPTVQVNGYGTLSVNTENDEDNGTVPLPSSRSTQKFSNFTRQSSSSTNLSSPLSHGEVTDDFGHPNSTLPRIGSASSYSKVITTTTTKINRTGSASRISSSPRGPPRMRPGTAMGSNVDSERRGLKSSQYFPDGDRTLDYTARRTHNTALQPIPEGKFR